MKLGNAGLPAPVDPAAPKPAAVKPVTTQQNMQQQIAGLSAARTAAANAAPAAAPSLVGTAPSWLQTQQAKTPAGNVTMTNVDMTGLPEVSSDYSGDALRGAEAAYKGATQFFDEDFGRDRAALQTDLANKGFAVGSEAYNNELSRMERGQNAARENAGFMAQGIGFQQAGDLLSRALANRAASLGERTSMADRLYGQSLGVANLGLGARGQDKAVQSAATSASQGAAASRYATDANTAGRQLDAELALRRLGLDESGQDFNQTMTLANMSRAGVNMPNFGPPIPLDVGNAYGIASANNNAAQNRAGSDRNALYQLGGSLLGSYLGGR